MARKITQLLVLSIVCLCSSSISAQDKAAYDRLIAARAQYYTPTANGLQSFSCEVSIPWKELLERVVGKAIPDDDAFLKYFQSAHISVTDDLKGKGTLDWANTGTPPEGKEKPAADMRRGLQTTVGGFFQTWNIYMNGNAVPLPDATVTVTAAGPGIHLHGLSQGTTIDEDLDKDMLLTKIDVLSPVVKVAQSPTFVNTPDGRLVSAITSVINQPPTAPPSEATVHIDYARVESFQIPSHIVFDIKNTGIIEVNFNACHVTLFAKKP